MERGAPARVLRSLAEAARGERGECGPPELLARGEDGPKVRLGEPGAAFVPPDAALPSCPQCPGAAAEDARGVWRPWRWGSTLTDGSGRLAPETSSPLGWPELTTAPSPVLVSLWAESPAAAERVWRGRGDTAAAAALSPGEPASATCMSASTPSPGVLVGGAEDGCTFNLGSTDASISIGLGPPECSGASGAGCTPGMGGPFLKVECGAALGGPERACALATRLSRVSDDVDARLDADLTLLLAAASMSTPGHAARPLLLNLP